MKYIAVILACLLPLSAQAAVTLANCDDESHEVIVSNGGTKRIVTITKYSGKIEEYGPPAMITFQLKDPSKDPGREQPIVSPLGPDHEFCIWSGKIRTQRLETGRSFRGGSAF